MTKRYATSTQVASAPGARHCNWPNSDAKRSDNGPLSLLRTAWLLCDPRWTSPVDMGASRLVAVSVTGVGSCTGHGRGRHRGHRTAPTLSRPQRSRAHHGRRRYEGLGKAARDRPARAGSRRTNRPSKGRQHDRHTPLNSTLPRMIKMLAASDASVLGFSLITISSPATMASASVAGVTAPDPRPVHVAGVPQLCSALIGESAV